MMRRNISLLIVLLFTCSALVGQTDSLEVGLLANFPLGPDARDVSGKGNNASTWAVKQADDRYASPGKATHFETRNNVYGNLKTSLNLNPAESPQVTITLWVKFDQLSASLPVISMGDNKKFRALGTERDDDNPVWRLGCGGRGEILGPMITADWTFVAVVYDQPNNAARLVVNNEVFASRTSMRSGKEFTVFGNFSGTVDEIRVYNRVLSLKELEALYGSPINQNAGDYPIVVREDYKKEKALKQRAELDSLRSRIVLSSKLNIYDSETHKSKIDFLVSGDSLQIVEIRDGDAIVSFKDGRKGAVDLGDLYDYTRSTGETGIQRRISIALTELFDFTSLKSWIIVGLLLVFLIIAFRFFYKTDDFFMRMKKDKVTLASGGKADATMLEHKPSVLSRIFPLKRFRKWPLYIGALIATIVLGSFLLDKHEAEWFVNKGIALIPKGYDVAVHWILWSGMILTLFLAIMLIVESYTIAGPLGGTLRVVYLLLVNFVMLVVTFYLFILVLIILAVMFGLFLLSAAGSGTKYRCTRCGRIFYGDHCPNCG